MLDEVDGTVGRYHRLFKELDLIRPETITQMSETWKLFVDAFQGATDVAMQFAEVRPCHVFFEGLMVDDTTSSSQQLKWLLVHLHLQ
jgi:hypothetical protein